MRSPVPVPIRCQSVSSSSNTVPLTETKLASLNLVASRNGLDPSINLFHAPIVYHENYSFADWPENHTFPVSFP